MPNPRKTSKVWEYFTKHSDNAAECHICGHMLSYRSSTTNLAKHLKRKHPSSYSGDGDEDPREGLKEFITLETADGFHGDDDNDDGPSKETADTEWTPPKKFLRKSVAVPQLIKKPKPEVITSSGVEYLIYPSVEATRAPTRFSAPPLTKPTKPTAPAEAKQPDEDEFSIFARFLAQRVRTLKDPYWQSCAINEINGALHKVEMRRYEPPRATIGADFSVQTDIETPNTSMKTYDQMSSNSANHGQESMRTDVVEEIVTSHDVVEWVKHDG